MRAFDALKRMLYFKNELQYHNNHRSFFMTSTMVLAPIMAALCKATMFVGADPASWFAVNQTQQHYLQNYHIQRGSLSHFNEKELRCWASNDHNELNSILKSERFSIELEPFRPGGFGVVSILDVMINWLYQGEKSTINHAITQQEYPAVYIDTGFAVYKSTAHQFPVVRIPTKTNDVVWMTIADKPRESFELVEHIQHIAHAIDYDEYPEDYSNIRFPMVDLDQEVDISWLMGMQFPNYFIAQAKQQTKFKMNETGARVRSAVAIGIEKTCMPLPRKKCIIDQPFYLWIERPGVKVPVFAGYISEENWKDPQNLDL